jgi:DNA replication licensing factor MCM5
MDHLQAFDDGLVRCFRNNPSDYIKVFESAVETIYRNDYYDETNPDMEIAPKFQVQVHSDENPKMLRELQSDSIGKLICIPGIIVSTSKSSIRARKAVYTCRNCGHEKVMEVPFGLTRAMVPSICDRQRAPGADKQNCRIGSYVMNTDKCEFVDQQIIKLQEAPELIPTGEMPRSLLLTVDRELTDKCTPGNRIKVVGILSITKGSQNNADTNANK